MLSSVVVSDIPKHKVRLMEHNLSTAEQVQEAVACLPAWLQAMLATDAPLLAAIKDRSTATSIHKRQIDSETASKPANPTQIRPHPYLPLPKNRRASSERSSSTAGLNTACTSTPSLVVSCGREEETTPTPAQVLPTRMRVPRHCHRCWSSHILHHRSP